MIHSPNSQVNTQATTQKLTAVSLLLSLSVSLFSPVWANEHFSTNWQAKPLIDHSAPAAATPTNGLPAPKVTQPTAEQLALEAKLKPAEPFISGVEKQLMLSPKAGTPIIDRLNALQSVLYGATKYQDAGELLAAMADLFPAEAAKAQTDLQAKLKAAPPATTTAQTQPKSNPRQPTFQAPQTAALNPSFPSAGNRVASPPKKRFWQSDEDPFANDPFFRDEPSSSFSGQAQQTGPSKLAAIGQGLAGLAMMAGSVAGSYYLNRNNGNTVPLQQNGYYNNVPYGYGYNNPYGVPYGYGANTYGLLPGQIPLRQLPLGQVPFGQVPLGQVPLGFTQQTFPYQGYPGMSLTNQPYQRYGSSTTTISPLGVPTIIRPY